MITHDRQRITPSPTGHLVLDRIQIITTAINRIRNKLDYQPQIPRTLGNTFTLRQVREVSAAFLGTAIDGIDDPNFKKTHNHLFKEVGTATLNHSRRSPEFYRLN